jgi:REP element-mobilizing transposase RayT
MLQTEHIYHIYNHANGNENLFRTDENYRYFLEKYAFYITQIADTFCYCLMPNHFHLLIKPKSEIKLLPSFENNYSNSFKDLQGFKNLEGLQQDLIISTFVSQQFSNLFNSYSKSYNKMYNRKGSLFMPRFKYKLIDNENYYSKVIHYIHSNPIHHNFVTKLEDWKWSSYISYLSTKKTKLAKDDVIGWFGNLDDFKKAHSLNYDVDLEKLLE